MEMLNENEALLEMWFRDSWGKGGGGLSQETRLFWIVFETFITDKRCLKDVFKTSCFFVGMRLRVLLIEWFKRFCIYDEILKFLNKISKDHVFKLFMLLSNRCCRLIDDNTCTINIYSLIMLNRHLNLHQCSEEIKLFSRPYQVIWTGVADYFNSL